jgi:NADP-dependent 3-hydroxy acid dehydrogenase YdfG
MAERIVIITGASGGIGEGTAKLLASKGTTVALATRRGAKLRQVASEIRASGGNVSVHEVDATDKGRVTSLVDGVVDRHGRLDAIVNTAGLMAIAPISLAKTDERDWMIDVKIKGLPYARRLPDITAASA